MIEPCLLVTSYSLDILENIKKIIFNSDKKNKITLINSNTHSKSQFLNNIGLGEIQSEILISVIEKDNFFKIDSEIKKLKINQKNGFLYLFPVARTMGINEEKMFKGDCFEMLNAIFTIVDKGNAFEIISTANSLGATGATIINARGSGKFINKELNLDIEPEKEIVLIIATKEMEEKITNALEDKFNLSLPNKGISFTVPIINQNGLIKK